MNLEMTLSMIGIAAFGVLLSLWAVRRKRKPGPPPLVPWHGIMFVSLLMFVLGAAHLPAVWP